MGQNAKTRASRRRKRALGLAVQPYDDVRVAVVDARGKRWQGVPWVKPTRSGLMQGGELQILAEFTPRRSGVGPAQARIYRGRKLLMWCDCDFEMVSASDTLTLDIRVGA